MKNLYFAVLILLIYQNLNSAEPIGKWTFNNSTNYEKADVGNDLILIGTRTVNQSIALGKDYVSIPKGSYYKCVHSMMPVGTETDINEYSMLFDFKVPASGQYYCFYQTDIANLNDGEIFISPSMSIGITATGYSTKTIKIDEWYRLLISVKNGEQFNFYLDGELILQGTAQSIDSRFGLNKDTLLFFADENGEDNDIDISQIQLFNKALTQEEVTQLGRFEHIKYKEILAYLQSPTDSSIYVCWQYSGNFPSKVEYYKAGEPNNVQTLDAEFIIQDSTTYWYSACLNGLQADTKYIYKCISGDLISDNNSFYTYPKKTKKDGHIRMILMSDCQSDFNRLDINTGAIKEKLTELYGDEYNKEVNLIFLSGDIVGNGNDLESYYTEYFKPFSKLSCNIPIMACIGNHEQESEYYYKYMKTMQFAGPDSNRYYKFNCGPISMFALNTIYGKNSQLDWFNNNMNFEQADSNTLFIMSFMHYPTHSEIWPEGNSYWVENYIDPVLRANKKSVIKSCGHAHCYERGALLDSGNTYTLIVGGAAGGLDRWGAYTDQRDYTEIQKAIDVYHWVLIDFDLQDSSFKAYTYSMGNAQRLVKNELIDYFEYKVRNLKNAKIEFVEPEGTVKQPLTVKLQFPMSFDSISCVEIIISEYPEFDLVTLDTMICKENIYGGAGSPDYLPIDLNKNIDLNNLKLSECLAPDIEYYYRVRYRDIILNWSDYSSTKSIKTEKLAIEDADEVFAKIVDNYPWQSSIELYAHESGTITYYISDILGKPISEASIDVSKGFNSIKIEDNIKGFVIIRINYSFSKGIRSKVLKAIL